MRSIGGYSTTPTSGADARLIEGWALTEVARRMHLAQTTEPKDTKMVHLAVTTNLRLWTIIQAYLLDPSCTVPRKVRINILALSRFIDKRTSVILANPKTESLDALISINRGLAKGLMTYPCQSVDAKFNRTLT